MKITCLLPFDVDFYFVGRVLAGLYGQPGADLRIEFVDWIKYSSSIGIEVNGMRFGVELADNKYLLDEPLLDWCDIYAKRCLSATGPTAISRKIVPYSLHCAGRSTRSTLGLLVALAKRDPLAMAKRQWDIRRYLMSPHWEAFEYLPTDPVSDLILYQTRLWSPEEAPGDDVMNQQRIDLLLDLKHAFKDRFIGGIVPNAYSLKTRPDLVTTKGTRQQAYVQWAKKPAIGIYSRGLFDSIAFKMAEYAASSKCIVSEPVENILPAPLDCVSFYRSNADCLTLCESLLSNPKLVQEYRAATWNYYCDYVRPASAIAKLLEPAIGRPA
jgi:hypothetical protein